MDQWGVGLARRAMGLNLFSIASMSLLASVLSSDDHVFRHVCQGFHEAVKPDYI